MVLPWVPEKPTNVSYCSDINFKISDLWNKGRLSLFASITSGLSSFIAVDKTTF